MIYLDNSATTVPDSSVVNSFQKVAENFYANPSSIHTMGAEVEKLQTKARQQAAQLLQVNKEEIIFTSGGTEGNNLSIKGIAFEYKRRGNHIITTDIEHPSVYEACKSLEQDGFKVTYLQVNEDGVVNIDEVKAALTDDTILFSMMHVNNETGAIQPIKAVGDVLKDYPKVIYHVDAVQALGKVPVNIKQDRIDLCTFSGHKIHGLKGTGMLFVRQGIRLFPLFHGGNQEQGFRSGTENVAGNIAFVRALRLAKEQESETERHLRHLQSVLLKGLNDIEEVHVNSSCNSAPHIMNFSVVGIRSETIIHALYEQGYIISTQSACSSKANDISRVLKAYGYSDDIAKSGLRVSLSHLTTEDEIIKFLKALTEVITNLKKILG